MSASDLIPTLRLTDFTQDAEKRKGFIKVLAQSFATTGFVLLSHHGIPAGRREDAFEILPYFFKSLTQHQRNRYIVPGVDGQMGYVAKGIETAVGAKTADMKHFWHMPFVSTGHCLHVREVPAFAQRLMDLGTSLNNVYFILLEAVAESIELGGEYASANIGNSLLRALHYPAHDDPQTSDEAVRQGVGNGMCAAPHTDINMLTLLYVDSPGLEVWFDGSWLPIDVDKDTLVINCGDMLEHLTNGYYRSAVHRVVGERNTDRYSVPYFGHVQSDVSLVPLPRFGAPLPKFHFSTAGEFLNDRLEKIKLKA